MATFMQDYPPLLGSIEMAVSHVRKIVAVHQPARVDDAEAIVRALMGDALTRTGPNENISMITMADPGRIRFEVHDPNTSVPGAYPDPDAHRIASARADRYGSRRTRDGHMYWAELHGQGAHP
ncbi:hypothetical protein [Streptosporangium sp. NPDC051022]|uniref:hypothetical protein n=1 Tax=Streptosporangium sp. NPDC051022 TaxID=3155752 RepID=UPI003421F5F0